MKSQWNLKAQAWVFLCMVVMAGGTALAFPPAPDHVITGILRSELGDPVVSEDATIILETSSGVRMTAPVFSTPVSGVNYRLKVPMDSGLTSDAYRPTALRPTVPFRIKVTIGLTTYLPIQMKGDYSHLGQPAQETRLDLTLGEDSMGDGIPDAWKRMVVAMSGGVYTNISQIHASGHYPNNPMTFLDAYVAGTYPWDLAEGFALTIVSMNADSSIMEFLAIQSRNYTIHGSADLQQWASVKFKLATDGATAPLMDNYQAADVRKIRIVVPFQGYATNILFFKAMVR